MISNFQKNCSVYETTCKNNLKPDRPQMTIWRMRISCWINKATNTNSENVTFTAFPLQQWFHERASMLCTLPVLLDEIWTVFTARYEMGL